MLVNGNINKVTQERLASLYNLETQPSNDIAMFILSWKKQKSPRSWIEVTLCILCTDKTVFWMKINYVEL